MIATSFSLTTFLELKKKRTQGTKLERSKVVSYATIVQLHKKMKKQEALQYVAQYPDTSV